MFDVIVVGARCAGSPLAMLLSRKGYRVLLVDKARFPSDTISTHLIWHAGLARAKKWGLLQKIVDLGAPPIRTVRLDTGKCHFSGRPPLVDGVDYAIAPRRTALDKMLVDAAVEAGVEMRAGVYVSEIVMERGRATGIRGRTRDGHMVQELARIVIGADGIHSFVAHAVRAPKYNEIRSTSCAWYAYWKGGPQIADFEIWFRAGWGGAAFPTNGGLTCIVGTWTDSFVAASSRPEDGYRKFMEGNPLSAEFLRRGKQVDTLAGVRELPGYFRKSYGNGWALAGDASYHKHPLSAQGITDAFRDADLLSGAIDEGLSGRLGMQVALAEFERRRNEAVMPMYKSVCARADFEPFSPRQVALFHALRHDQLEADRFFGTDAGTVTISEFFAPDNLERIIRSARSTHTCDTS
jgi:flavin-dependent dehydrogenase